MQGIVESLTMTSLQIYQLVSEWNNYEHRSPIGKEISKSMQYDMIN